MRLPLTRSSDAVLAGVCGGIADYLGWSPNAVRIAYVFFSIILTGFPGIIVYLVLWFLMPPAKPY
jgi:phage shock protein PspC (stress-responsive transcriptional regulator)